MLEALLKTRLQALFAQLFTFGRAGKKRSAGMKLLIALLVLYVIASLGFSIGAMFDMLYVPYRDAGLRVLYHAMCALAAFMMSFVGSVFLAQSMLYEARDNEMLLSLPIKPGSILLSRTAVLLLFVFVFQQIILLPSAAVWLIHGPVSFTGIFMYLLTSLFLPLPALALSLLGGWLLAIITQRVRHKTLVVTLLSLLFLFAYFAVFTQLPRYLNRLIASGEQIAQAFQKAMFPAWHYGLAVAEGSIASLLLFALTAVLPLLLVLYVISKSYLRILTMKRGAPKAVYSGRPMKAGSMKGALLKKELQRFFSCPAYMLNSGLGLVFILALPVLLLVNRGILDQMMAQFSLAGAAPETFTLLILTMITALNMVSAPSVSLEGKAFWILKSLPVSPKDALLGKVRAHLMICLPPVLLACIATALIQGAALPLALLMILLPALMTLMSGLLGVLLNLRFPKFDWTHEIEPVKQGIGTILTLLASFLLVAGPAALYALVLRGKPGLVVFATLAALFYSAVCGLLYLLLRRWGTKAYQDLTA